MAWLVIRVGHNCNEKCIFCFNNGKEKELTFDEIKKSLSDAAFQGHKTVEVSGGEPTVRTDIIDILNEAKKLKLNVSLQTNGLKLRDKEFAKEILNTGVKNILIAFHSNRKDIQDKVTQVPGSYEKTLQGMQNIYDLSEEGTLSLMHVINNLNYKYLEEYFRFIYEKFPKIEILLSFINITGRASEHMWIVPKISEVEPYLHNALKFAKENNLKIKIPPNCGIPFCYLKNFEEFTTEFREAFVGKNEEIVNYYLVQRSKTKGKNCFECAFDNICLGFWINYLKYFGDEELIPKKYSKQEIQDMIEKVSSSEFNKSDGFKEWLKKEIKWDKVN